MRPRHYDDDNYGVHGANRMTIHDINIDNVMLLICLEIILMIIK
jgi:hypothetical protein